MDISAVETLPMDLSPFAQSMFPQQGTQPAQPQGTQPAQPQEAAQQPDVVEEEQGGQKQRSEGRATGRRHGHGS